MKINFNNAPKLLLLLFIFVCPFFYHSGINLGDQAMRIAQEQFFQLSAIVFMAFMLKNLWLSLFLLWSVFLYSFYGFNGQGYLINALSVCAIYEFTHRFVDKKWIKHVFGIFIALICFHVFWMALQTINFDVLYKIKSQGTFVGEGIKDLMGIMGIKAASGMILAMGVPIAFRFNKYLPLLLFFPLALSECSSALVAALLAYAFCLSFAHKKLVIGLLLVSLLGGGIYIAKDYQTGMFEDRFKLWKPVLRDAMKHPITGWGLDSFRNVSKYKRFNYFKNVRTRESAKMYPTDKPGQMRSRKDFFKEGDTVDPWDNAHNEFIMVFFEYGIVGLLILFGLIRDIKRRFNSSNINVLCIAGVFISLLIMSIGQFPFHLARVGFIFPILLAIYYKETEIKTIGE
jgi:O-antigen ligase